MELDAIIHLYLRDCPAAAAAVRNLVVSRSSLPQLLSSLQQMVADAHGAGISPLQPGAAHRRYAEGEGESERRGEWEQDAPGAALEPGGWRHQPELLRAQMQHRGLEAGGHDFGGGGGGGGGGGVGGFGGGGDLGVGGGGAPEASRATVSRELRRLLRACRERARAARGGRIIAEFGQPSSSFKRAPALAPW